MNKHFRQEIYLYRQNVARKVAWNVGLDDAMNDAWKVDWLACRP